MKEMTGQRKRESRSLPTRDYYADQLAKRKGLRCPNTKGPTTASAATPAVVASPPSVTTASRLGSEMYWASSPRMVMARGAVNRTPVANAVVAGMRASQRLLRERRAKGGRAVGEQGGVNVRDEAGRGGKKRDDAAGIKRAQMHSPAAHHVISNEPVHQARQLVHLQVLCLSLQNCTIGRERGDWGPRDECRCERRCPTEER